MSGPFAADVHVPRPLTEEERKVVRETVTKSGLAPLYVYRNVQNAQDIVDWAKAQGFKTTLPADQLHVTICYSRNPVDWMAMGEAFSPRDDGTLHIAPGGPRAVEQFDGGAVVLEFTSWDLMSRNKSMQENGASWDWPEYTPHITISYDASDLDLANVKPYAGKIILGPEIFEPLVEDWKSSIVEKVFQEDSCVKFDGDGNFSTFAKVVGVDEELGLVFGWGLICKMNGADYWDSDRNHVPEDSMLSAVTEYMKTSREAGDLHERMGAGTVVHSFPLTSEIAKALGIKTEKTGWLVAMAPDAEMLKKFVSGEYTGFSIGGHHIELEAAA